MSNVRQRLTAASGVLIIILSLVASLPVYEWLTAAKYQLNEQALVVVGAAKPELAKKLVFDEKQGVYQFNAQAKKSMSDTPADIAKKLQQNVTGEAKDKNLYSLDLPKNASDGTTIYDNNSGLSFKMVPQFAMQDGRKVQDHLVYPMSDGTKTVYTMKNNGLKEDIVFAKSPRSGDAQFSYDLQLPDTLESRLMPNGSLGIYSADPNLFGDISFGSDADQQKVESARKNAPKEYLVFGIPAPTIVAADGKINNATAAFTIHDHQLTIKATGLDSIDGAFSIDPSVVVTSTNDFISGNNEANIKFATDELQRGAQTGGAVSGSWTTASNNTPTNISQGVSIAYNGYLYIVGGTDNTNTVDLSTTVYAPISANGNIGTWTTSPMQFTNARYYHTSVIYNGYLYVMGGRNTAATRYSDVQYTKLNADGSLSAWQTTTSLTQIRAGFGAFAMRGYMYFMGGTNGTTTYNNDSYCAPINADGTLGAWTATTSFTTGRYGFGLASYDRTVYILGGMLTGDTVSNDVQYARQNDDGTLTSWTTTTAFTTARYLNTVQAVGGYLYMEAGNTTTTSKNDVQFAPILPNGSLGAWQTTTAFTNARNNSFAASYNNTLYIGGGLSGANAATATKYSDVQYVSIAPPGGNGAWATTTASPTVTSKGKTYGRYGHTTVAYKGYLYLIGGYQNGAGLAETLYAPINANGTVGTWTATTSLPAARYYHASVVANGYVYVLGGYTTAGTNTVLYAPLSPTGGIGAWTTNTTSFTNIRTSLSAATYNGYVYVMAGYAGATEYNDVQFAPLNANGSVGTWQYTYNSAASGGFVGGYTTGRDSAYTVAMNGYLYIVGGWNGTTNYADVQYAPINANGTIGTWAATTSLTTARHGFVGATNKGCLYAAGGSIGGSDTATGEYACANSNGSLGAWQASPSFTNGREYAGGTISSAGILYITGGFDGGIVYYSDTQYSIINNGGADDLGSWGAATNLDIPIYRSSSVAVNGYIYILGGSDGFVDLTNVQYAPINPDGTLGTWQSTTSFATARSGLSSIVYNGNIYILGGNSGTSYYNDVQYAPINANGTLGAWLSTTAFTTGRGGHSSVTYNGYVYVFGGSDGTYLNDVQYAPINANGTLGAWLSTTSFTTGRSDFTASINNGRIYVAAGYSSGTYLADVQFASINQDGSIGSWTTTTSLPSGRYGATVAVFNGYLYIIGGAPATGGSYNTVLSAPFNVDGTLGVWSTVNSFTTARYSHSSTVYNGTVYILGGSSGTATKDVQRATFTSLPRKARYSKFIDLGSTTTVSNITYTGNLANGRAAIQFKVAGSNGIFGSWHTATELTGPCGVALSARYLMIDASLNDTTHSDAYDMAASSSTIQDITVDYGVSVGPSGVDPSLRLRGGKYFDVSTGIKPLDTLKTIGGGAGC